MVRLANKLNAKIVDLSNFVAFFTFIKLPPNPESIRTLATLNIIANTPIVPKSSDDKYLASIIVVTKYIPWGANFDIPPDVSSLILHNILFFQEQIIRYFI